MLLDYDSHVEKRMRSISSTGKLSMESKSLTSFLLTPIWLARSEALVKCPLGKL